MAKTDYSQKLEAPNGMYLSFVKVTPATASAWLTQNGANRRIREAAVNSYATDMVAGDWQLIPHAICFSADGTLLNGQHTLSALVKASVTLWLLIARHVSAEVVAVMDSGRTRTIADQLKMVGDGSDKRALQLARYIRAGRLGAQKSGLMSFNAALAEYAEHKEAVDFALRSTTHGKRRGHSTAFLTVIARAYYSVGIDQLSRFLEILDTGITSDICDSGALKLRDYMLSAQHAGSSQQRELYEKTQAALRAFLDRRIVQRLTGVSDEVFTIPAG